MKINPKILKIIKNKSLDSETALHCLWAVFTRGEQGLSWCLEKGFIDPSNEHIYRIALFELNPETDKLELRHPLLIIDNQGDFIDFYIQVGSKLPNTKGKLDNTKQSKAAYEALTRQIKDFNQQRLIDATVEYYKTTEFSKKLSNYLVENALLVYETYTDYSANSNML